MSKLFQTTFDFIEQLEQQQTVSALAASFQEVVESYGLVGYAIGEPGNAKMRRDNVLWATTWPQEFIDRWESFSYEAVDPAVLDRMALCEPFHWKELRQLATGICARIMDEGREIGLGEGYGLPFRGSNGAIVSISIGGRYYDLCPSEEACLHLAAIYFYERFAKLREGPSANRSPRLSPRERDCLTWVAAGKTDWEISQILSISQGTAHDHVRNAMAKLGASSRAHAVAVALVRGAITF